MGHAGLYITPMQAAKKTEMPGVHGITVRLASTHLHDKGSLPDAAARTLLEVMQKYKAAGTVVTVAFVRKDHLGRNRYIVSAVNAVQGEQSWDLEVYPDGYIFSVYYGAGGWNGELEGHGEFLAHLHACGYMEQTEEERDE
jgi:hypothetical protein